MLRTRSAVRASFVAMALAAVAPTVAHAQSADKPAPVATLVSAVNIPYQAFTLDNGLRVLVHTDRKAPVVAISVWYGIGSKNEPKGKTGFAHLFEHLMFNGTENVPGDFFQPLQHIGATDVNGTTWFDRTNYFETVPTGALDAGLMLESDRMGHLLGGITQEKLDNQRGVVQNEKRQGDNQPYGLVEYEQLENIYPSGHPYHHSTIGSMADLNSASLDDVKQWFRDGYGPNNAILVLAGDIDLPTAKAKVAKWFGDIPRGPAVKPVSVPVPTLAAPAAKTIYDAVATTRIQRVWAIPGLDNPDNEALDMAAMVLGGLASSRLDDALVRQGQLAVRVSADAQIFAQGGQFVVEADAKPGVDVAKVNQALDAEIARFIAEGPTADELQRAATVHAAGRIRGLETTGGFGGKAPALAEGLLYNNDPAYYRTSLIRAAKLKPADVTAVAKKWLSRPAFSLTVMPGERKEGGEARGGYAVPVGAKAVVGARPAFWHNPFLDAQALASAPVAASGDRSKVPAVGQLAPLDFPAIERATLANGMKVFFARRTTIPAVSIRLSFDAGYSADPASALGTQSLLLNLMGEGTDKLDSTGFARARERLGANIGAFADIDSTNFQLDAMTANLGPSLKLLADYVRRPALAPAELERVRGQQLAAIGQELNNPNQIARRVLAAELYGPGNPYSVPPSGLGDAAVVKRLTRDDLVSFHHNWFRPDLAKVFVVGNTTLAEVKRLLEASFGDWRAPATAAPVKNLDQPVPPARDRIVLIDRPNSPQSVILAGKVLTARGGDDTLTLRSANDILGGNFLGRLNMNLREDKGWSYGVGSGVTEPMGRISFRISAPVQSDKTGASIGEIRKELKSFMTDKGVTAEELSWSTNGSARALPGQFETSGAVLGALARIVQLGRPDNYYEQLSARYGAMTTAQLDAAARAAISADGMTYVVVGDAAKVRTQLDALGLPVEVRPAPKP